MAKETVLFCQNGACRNEYPMSDASYAKWGSGLATRDGWEVVPGRGILVCPQCKGEVIGKV